MTDNEIEGTECSHGNNGNRQQVAHTAYFLVGPTAAGKSAVAQWIAQNGNYEILSADSMQVYRGMDIGTAKPSREDRASVNYHGIDLTTPDKPFSVWSYTRYARKALADIRSRGRKAVIVGGTGLYIKSLTDGLRSIPASDPAYRTYWTGVLDEKGVGALQEELRKRRPDLYDSLRDKQNGRRLIRAIEMAEAGIGNGPGSWVKYHRSAPLVGLTLPADELKSRIESRVADMYCLGLVDEVRKLLKQYGAFSPSASQAIGYAEAVALVEGRCSREEAMSRTVVRTRQLAKRQRTWFRHQVDVKWIDIRSGMHTREIARMVLDPWRQYGETEIEE